MGENSKIEWCDHTFNPWIWAKTETDKEIRIFLSVMKRMVQFVRPGQGRYEVGRIGPKSIL